MKRLFGEYLTSVSEADDSEIGSDNDNSDNEESEESDSEGGGEEE